jgi:Holliday junction DNA helicase RuvA
MIASIHGEIIKIETDGLIINIGGIGFRVFATDATRQKATSGDRIFLYTHLVVREEVLALYGFETEDEKEIFHLLLGVNGVGPRLS